MEITTTEALDAITLDTWNHLDETRIRSFMARHAIENFDEELAA